MSDDREVRHRERLGDGWIEVWRQTDGSQWFVSRYPDQQTMSDYPGQTYSAVDAGVPNTPDELLAWARNQFSG
jgi:hypothetical protein